MDDEQLALGREALQRIHMSYRSHCYTMRK